MNLTRNTFVNHPWGKGDRGEFNEDMSEGLKPALKVDLPKSDDAKIPVFSHMG